MERRTITRTDGTTVTGFAYPHLNVCESPTSRPPERYDWLMLDDEHRMAGWFLITRERIAAVSA